MGFSRRGRAPGWIGRNTLFPGGEQATRRRGGLVDRGEDTWGLVINHIDPVTGKRRQKWHTFHGSRKAAEKELSRLLNEADTNNGEIKIDPPKIIVVPEI